MGLLSLALPKTEESEGQELNAPHLSPYPGVEQVRPMADGAQNLQELLLGGAQSQEYHRRGAGWAVEDPRREGETAGPGMVILLFPWLLFHLLSPTEKERSRQKGETGGRDGQGGRGVVG